MKDKEFGKIQSVQFGFNEYLFGLSLTLSGKGWGVWTGYHYNPTYKNENIEHHSVEMLSKVQQLMKDAKVNNIADLKDKPVEVTFDGMLLRDFRILAEVV